MSVSPSTIKRLFALSNNLCAFPGCIVPLVHNRKVTGKICHIAARSPKGPRFDTKVTPAERDGFDNLILMCGTHHDIIDDDETTYSVGVLKGYKAAAQNPAATGPAIADEEAEAISVEIQHQVAGDAVIITTVNQTGGQNAGVINNFGPRDREISAETRGRMIAHLTPFAGSAIGFASTQGDIEAHRYKAKLMQIFRAAGWQVHDQMTFMFFETRTGLVLSIPAAAPEAGLPQVAYGALAMTGEAMAGNRGPIADAHGLCVLVWHALAEGR